MKKIHFSIIVILFLLVGMFFFSFWYQIKKNEAHIISQDIKTLSTVFKRIHDTCFIIDFNKSINNINFLNVGKFTGSEVGPMNLAHPDKWEGPYLSDNLTMQTVPYQIVCTNKGYFITPGNGVRLPNNQILGTDIVLTEESDIHQLMLDDNALFYKGYTLAISLPFIKAKGPGYWGSLIQ